MTTRSQEGIALVLCLLFVLAMSAVGASMAALSQSEAFASQNYTLMTQARYAAESGVHAAVNYLLNTYTPPGAASDPLAAYNMAVSPVTFNGQPVVLSSDPAVASNYPVAATQTAFAAATSGTLPAGGVSPRYVATARLQQMRVVNGQTVLTWAITGDGLLSGVRNGIVEVTATLEKQVTATPNAVFAAFATSGTCGALTWSSATTDSYDSTAALVNNKPVISASGGNVGTNGNLNVNNAARVNGTVSTPRVGVGQCSAGNVDAVTSSGGATITGGVLKLPQVVTAQTPPLPNPLPDAAQNINVTDVSNCPAGVTGCSKAGNGDKTFLPGTYGNFNLTDTARLHLKAGVYNVNSLVIDNASRLILDTSPVIINVVGTNKTTPFWLNSSVSTDPTRPWDPNQLQINYAGTGTIRFDNQATSVAKVNAPNASVVVNSSDYYGTILGSTVTFGNAAKLHFDRNLGAAASMTYTVGADMLTAFSWRKS